MGTFCCMPLHLAAMSGIVCESIINAVRENEALEKMQNPARRPGSDIAARAEIHSLSTMFFPQIRRHCKRFLATDLFGQGSHVSSRFSVVLAMTKTVH